MSPRLLAGWVVGIAVSAVFLWFALRDVDLNAVEHALRHARTGWLLLALGGLGGVYVLQAVRWREIAAAPQVRTARFCEMVVSGVACNNVLPARLGDVLRARWLGREAPMPAGRAFGTVVVDRGCDLVTLFVLLIIGIATVASSDWLLRIAAGAAAALTAFAAAILFARAYTRRRERERRSRRLLRRLTRDVVDSLAEPMRTRRPVLWILTSFAAWMVWALAAIAVARSLGIQLSVLDAVFVTGVVNLGVAIPSSPGFIGTYEWLGVASLGLLGVGRAQALAFSILLHASWYIPTTIVGGAALGARTILRTREARRDRPAAVTMTTTE